MPRIPEVTINQVVFDRLCADLNVRPIPVLFEEMIEKDPMEDERTYTYGDPRANVLGIYERSRIRIFLHKKRIGRIVSDNKRKKIERQIVETFLHEMRHHHQHVHRTMPGRTKGEDYYTHPTEVDARAYAKRAWSRYKKLVTIS